MSDNRELADRRDALPTSDEGLAARREKPPELAVIECDDGRFRMREPGHGRGVHFSGVGWRETKNACLIYAIHCVFDDDPQLEPHARFLEPKHVAKIAETEALSVAAPAAIRPPAESSCDDEVNSAELREHGKNQPNDWRPKRLVRTVVASVKCARDFGRQVAREANRRRFLEAPGRVFLGDGLPWNGTIWKEQFADFTPVLNFIHPLSYPCSDDDAWSQYVAWMRGCWQGDVEQVLDELFAWETRLGMPPDKCPVTDPRQIVASTITYLTNNVARMNCPAYRRVGVPITTDWMESLVKEMAYRVIGTEMSWNDPDSGEAILQARAATLSEDDRLSRHIHRRPGHPFTRRPKLFKPPSSATAKTRKS